MKNRKGVVSFDRAYHGRSHGTEGYSMARKHVKPMLEDAFVVDAPKSYEIEIPEWIKSVDENYKLYFQHHSCITAESVLYAI